MDDTAPLPRPKRRLGRRGLVAAVVAVTVVAVGGAVAFAAGGDDDPPATTAAPAHDTDHDHGTPDATAGPDAGTTDAGTAGPDAPGGRRRGGAHHGHDHPALTPYADRYAAATPDQQAAADDLQAAVAATVAPYADVDDAVAAGYRVVPGTEGGIAAHYLDVGAARDGRVLDPSRPEGLVYYAAGDGDPVLLGAFFVAPPGQPVPDDAGGIVVWHSHDPACTGFFATPDQPCTDSRRMLHVWTADHVEINAPRLGRTVGIDIVDPFGAPFTASIARSD
jgi:hypothetical protein